VGPAHARISRRHLRRCGTRDRDLLARVANGDVEALRMLYDQHAPRAMAIARRILHRAEEAEDVVQDTFIEVWRRAAQYDSDRGGAGGWIVTIARSRAIDRVRAHGIAGRVLEGGDAAHQALAPAALASPAVMTEGRRNEVRVSTALAALPAEQRETIELAYFEGLTQSEIAHRTGNPLGTIKMRVKLGIKKLTGLLKEDDRDGET
jgi:RNA polymerase sigma-70 factor (ECF subfamily)